MFQIPDTNRLKNHPTLWSDDSMGNNGVFILYWKGIEIHCIASDGMGWEHVSVTIRNKIPTWEIMCYVKDIFWDKEDCILQYHPPKSLYVNEHNKCLHLWRPIGIKIPIPDPILVGYKKKDYNKNRSHA